MNLVHYQPWSLMDRLQREVDTYFNRSSHASLPALTNASTWTPLVDLQEENYRFVVRADVPGLELKDIEVSAEDGTLTTPTAISLLAIAPTIGSYYRDSWLGGDRPAVIE